MNTEWELALLNRYPTRNRRATTDSVVRENSVFTIRVLEDGRGVHRSAFYYRRHLNGGVTFTGLRSAGLSIHLQNAGL